MINMKKRSRIFSPEMQQQLASSCGPARQDQEPIHEPSSASPMALPVLSIPKDAAAEERDDDSEKQEQEGRQKDGSEATPNSKPGENSRRHRRKQLRA